MSLATWRDRQFGLAGRPVPPANLHLTLAFVGEVQPRLLESLCRDVDSWCESKSPAAGCVQLDQTGYWHRPGIYWLGPSDWPKSLPLLADGMRTIAARAGGKRERKRFQPHITLFRGCQVAPPAPATMPGLSLSYVDFYLFESVPGRQGVSYVPLQHWRLNEDG